MVMRFQYRNVHKSVCTFIEDYLTGVGWTSGSNDFSSGNFVFKEEALDKGINITQNTLAISLGDIPEDQLGELGAGFYTLELPAFFDIYSGDHSTSYSIGDDIRGALRYQPIVPIYDYGQDPPELSTDYIEFDHVIGPNEPLAASAAVSTDFKRHWKVVKATARVYFTP